MKLRDREVHTRDLFEKTKCLSMSFLTNELKCMMTEPDALSEETLGVIDRLLSCEVMGRQARKNKKQIRDLNLPYPSAHQYELHTEGLRSLNKEDFALVFRRFWIDKKHNVLISGKTKTGKSYVTSSLCVDAIEYEKRVKFMEFDAFIQQLNLESLSVTTPSTLLADIEQFDVIAVDNWCYHEVTPFVAGMVIGWLTKTIGKTSIILASELAPDVWVKRLATSKQNQKELTRLLNRSNRIELLPLTSSTYISEGGRA